jgi:hypothetical protein
MHLFKRHDTTNGRATIGRNTTINHFYTLMSNKKSLLANLLDYEEYRAALDLV